MKAAVFYGPERGIQIEEVPTPTPSAGEVLVRVAACGVCHTDLHYIDHGTPTFQPPPIVLGHEVSGHVEAVGEGVREVAVADRVLLPAVLTCGRCTACRTGRSNICSAQTMLGNHMNGGYAEFIVVPSKDVYTLPEEIPLEEGSIIADALTTPYHAVVNRARVLPGDWVVVVGCGGIGLNLVQFATALGGRVIALDVADKKLELAREFGAEATLNSGSVARVDKVVRSLSSGGANIALEAVGKAATQELALSCLATGGRLVMVGYSPNSVQLNAGRIMFRELEIVGSLGCRPVDYPRVIEMVRSGMVNVTEMVTHRFPLDRIEDAFETLRSGDAIRSVIVPTA